MFFGIDETPRWERQFVKVADLIAKETGLSKTKLNEVLKTLAEYRIVD